MKQKIYEKIKRKNHGEYASFAIWDDKNYKNLDIIENSINELNNSIVIIGLNASKSGDDKDFRAFHNGRNDNQLKNAFNKSKKFRGAYMTDLIKNKVTSNSSEAIDEFKKDEGKHLDKLKEELRDLKCKNLRIILMGKKVKELLFKNKKFIQELKSEFKIKIASIPHFAQHSEIQKEKFIRKAKSPKFVELSSVEL